MYDNTTLPPPPSSAPARLGIREACAAHGRYVLTTQTMHPATVIERLGAALRELAPEAHAALVAPGGALARIPAQALAAEADPYWSSDEATDALRELGAALNAAAPEGFELGFVGEWTGFGFVPIA